MKSSVLRSIQFSQESATKSWEAGCCASFRPRSVFELTRHAVEEYSTETGPTDYVLFVDVKLLGIIEAKKVSLGAENVLEQAKRYARGVPDTVGEWRGYKVPFLYSTNGESIFHLEVRR
jgi:type I restriction enzyme R subunit